MLLSIWITPFYHDEFTYVNHFVKRGSVITRTTEEDHNKNLLDRLKGLLAGKMVIYMTLNKSSKQYWETTIFYYPKSVMIKM